MKKFFWLSAVVLAAVLAYFVFIPAFTGKLFISPVITFGDYGFRWYGLFMAGSILAGYAVARHYSWRFGIDPKEIDDYAFWLVLVSFVGARLYYVAFDYRLFMEDPQEIYRVWHGGLSIYGAIISGLLFTHWYTRRKAYTSSQLMDVVALSMPVGQSIGRFGNFFNQEAFGPPTDLPWKMYVAPRFRPEEFLDNAFFHPTFLYEALLSILIFFILRKLIGKRSGVIFLSYLLLYAAVRFSTEFVRLDSVFVQGFRADQVLSLLVFVVVGAVLLRKAAKPSVQG